MKEKPDLGVNLDGIAGMAHGVIAPVPGQTGHYLCRSCGRRFTHKIPLFFVVRCPHCGSFSVTTDPMITH
jgi:transposase-like protein